MVAGLEGYSSEEVAEALKDEAREVEADAMTDIWRDHEREMWSAFVRSPNMATRKAHFQALCSLLREIDTRAMALLTSGNAP